MKARLGLGLAGIGRPWPAADTPVATAGQAAAVLQAAADLGVTLVDTARAYGVSEARLGAYLRTLGGRPAPFMVATKCGEFWSAERGSRTDHSLGSLENSVRASANLLGRIDLLQIHKATPGVVRDGAVVDVLRGLAAELGIPRLGVSASDVRTCDAALESGVFDCLQCPVNPASAELAGWAGRHCQEITIIANRPYGSGSLLDGRRNQRDLLRFAADHVGPGLVLTGTTNPGHLRQTHDAFPS